MKPSMHRLLAFVLALAVALALGMQVLAQTDPLPSRTTGSGSSPSSPRVAEAKNCNAIVRQL
jgi:hypothetical protein